MQTIQTAPMVLASCEIDVTGPQVTHDEIRARLHAGSVPMVAGWARRPWLHLFVVLVGEPGVELHVVARHRHGLSAATLRELAREFAFLRLGDRRRLVLHDAGVLADRMPSGVLRVVLVAVGSTSEAVPSLDPTSALVAA